MKNMMPITGYKLLITDLGTFTVGQEIWCVIHGEFCRAVIDEITKAGTLMVSNYLVGEAEIGTDEICLDEGDNPLT